MKKLYSLCFVFLMLISTSMTIAQAQEPELVTDEWEVTGIYKMEGSEYIFGTAYVYQVEGEGLFIRTLTWNDPNKVGRTPPEYDETVALIGIDDDGYYYTELGSQDNPDYLDVIFPDEVYGFYRDDKTIQLQQQIPAAPPYTKIADLYTETETEGPLSGIFCGSIEGVDDYAYICIKAAPTSEEVWKLDGVQSDNYPEIGTPVDYSVQKYNVFDPETLTSHSEDAVINIQSKR